MADKYREGYEKMKLSNEILLSKIEYFERKREKEEREWRERMDDLAAKVSGVEHENACLSEEKHMFITQIKSLEDRNKSQQNVIAYYQNNLTTSSAAHLEESAGRPIPALFNSNVSPSQYTFNNQGNPSHGSHAASAGSNPPPLPQPYLSKMH